MVRVHLDPPLSIADAISGVEPAPRERQEGALAQLGEHLLCKQRVVGSIPSSSTNLTRALKREDGSCLLRVQRIDL